MKARAAKPYQTLEAVAKRLDPTRPTIYAENHLHKGRKKKTLQIPDLVGVNYSLRKLDEARDESRSRVVVVSECTSTPSPRSNRDLTRSQVERFKRAWDLMDGKPYLAGYAVWCFNDYPTLRKKRYCRYSGIFDAWREPKPSFSLFQAQYSKDPFIELEADWGDSGQGSDRLVHLFTNCEETKLYCGDEEIAAGLRRTASRYRCSVFTPFATCCRARWRRRDDLCSRTRTGPLPGSISRWTPPAAP